MSYKWNDARRQFMRNQGFFVCRIICENMDPRRITAIWYRYAPHEERPEAESSVAD